MFEVQIVIRNSKFGEFKGRTVVLNTEQLDKIIETSKTFYNLSGFEMTCEDESFIVLPPSVVKESILIINRREIKNVQK